MKRYAIQVIIMLAIVGIQYGIWPVLVDRIPLPLFFTIGVMFASKLKPIEAMMWITAEGALNDFHSAVLSIDTVWYATVSLLLVWALSQYITHSSIYPPLSATFIGMVSIRLLHTITYTLFESSSYGLLGWTSIIFPALLSCVILIPLLWASEKLFPQLSSVHERYF